MNVNKDEYVMIPTKWLSDYDLFPKRLLHGEVVLCTKNPNRYAEEVYKIVPVINTKDKPPKEDAE